MRHHDDRTADRGGGNRTDALTSTEAWLRSRFHDLELNDVAWFPDISGVASRLQRQRRARRIAAGTVASLAIAVAAIVLVLPNDSTQNVTASDTSTTLQRDTTWSSASSNGFTAQISRRPLPAGDRLSESDLGNANAIPVPGLPVRAGCSVADILTVEVTSPSGTQWSGTYAEYRNRTLGYIDRAGAEVLDSEGRPSFAAGDPFDVHIVTGLGDGDRLSLADQGVDQITAAATNGVAVIAVDPAEELRWPSLTPTIGRPDGTASRPVTDQVDLYGGATDGTMQRDAGCSDRTIRPDATPGTPDETAAVNDAIHNALIELPAGRFSGLDLDLGVPALAGSTSGVDDVLVDAAARANASNYASLLSQIVASTSVVQHADDDTLVAQVGLSIAGMTSTVTVDLHRQGDQWQLSPQSVCAALVLTSTPCRPAP